MNGYSSDALAPHQIGVPGRGEAEALTDCCPGCTHPCRPASVLDEVRGRRTLGRIASYRCPRCDHAWLCWWAARLDGEARPDRSASASPDRGRPG
jgi:hypothetical protein